MAKRLHDRPPKYLAIHAPLGQTWTQDDLARFSHLGRCKLVKEHDLTVIRVHGGNEPHVVRALAPKCHVDCRG